MAYSAQALQEQDRRNRRSSPEELWDIYDARRQKTGRLHRRGDLLAEGDYHLAVQAWLRREDGLFLLTRRDPSKGFPLLWECTGGSAIAGEDSRTAILREIREETGLSFLPAQGRCLLQLQRKDHFLDVWLFEGSFTLEQVVLQPGETCGKRLASTEEIFSLAECKALVTYSYLQSLFANPALLRYNHNTN